MKGRRLIPKKKYHPRTREEFSRDPEDESQPVTGEADSDSMINPEPMVDSVLPSIAIVGRPNVGKSSLFNAILKRRHAIVHFDSGVTRDRVSASGVHQSCRFTLIDTGGLGMYTGEKKGVGFWDQMISSQVDAAVESADAIFFVVDVQAGLNPLDAEIADRLRSCGKKIFLIANKSDNQEEQMKADEFHALGFDTIYPVSCLHRSGVERVLDAALAGIPNVATVTKGLHRLKIAIMGRPNVGKSSMVNRLLGEDRVIVSNVPGTTRDAIDIDFMLKCRDEEVPATLIDTAGLRKKSKIDEAVEIYSMMRAEEALDTCDIVLFVLESSVGEATSQDKTIARKIQDSGKGCIIVANKWDIRADGKKQKELYDEIRFSLPQMRYAPIVFTCALTGYHFDELYEAIAELRAQLTMKVSTAMINRVVSDAFNRSLPPVVGIKPLKIYYATMIGNTPPKFMLFVNHPSYCSDTYKVYLENYFRKAFDFVGFPIRVILKERSRRDLSEVHNHQGSKHHTKKVVGAKGAKDERAKKTFQRKIESLRARARRRDEQ